MTTALDSSSGGPVEPRPSMLPFDPADLVAIRVRPAQFARMCGVSKQAVSQWIKQGKVTLDPDGRLDPAKAAREVFERTDPARLRARVFKSAMASRDDLRAKIRDLESRLANADAKCAQAVRAARFAADDAQAERIADLQREFLARFLELAEANGRGDLADALDRLIDSIFYPDLTADDDDAGDEAGALISPSDPTKENNDDS